MENYIIEINEDENKILKNLLEQISINSKENPILFCNKCKEICNLIPKRIKEKLFDFSKFSTDSGFLLLKNINFENNKKPESNSKNIMRDIPNLAKCQAIFIQLIADLISYEAEGNGLLFQDIIPIKSMENIQTSIGSNTELEVHTEQAFSNLRPDLLSLSCIRSDKNAYTYILPIKKLIENLNINEFNLLFKPLWKTGVDISFKINGKNFIEGDIRGPFSILSGSINFPTLVFDQDLMFGINEEANNLIKKIVKIYIEHRIQHNLQEGEIIIIDNNHAIHGRSPFFPKYDGNDRHLIRTFGTYNLEKSNYARLNNSRMISSIYS